MTSRRFIIVPFGFWDEQRPHSDHGIALLWLAAHANFAESPSYNPPLNRGELFRSYAQLSRAWGVDRRRAVTILDWLRGTGHVRTMTMRRGEEHRGCKLIGSGMLIEVVDYDTFNPSRRQERRAASESNGTPNRTANGTPNGTRAVQQRYTYAPENPSVDEGVTAHAERERYSNGTATVHQTVQPPVHPVVPTIEEELPGEESSPAEETLPPLPPVGARAGGRKGGRGDDGDGRGDSASPWRRGYSVEVPARFIREVVAAGPDLLVSFQRQPEPDVTVSLDEEGFKYLPDEKVWVAKSVPHLVRLLADIAPSEVPAPAPRQSGWSTAPELEPVVSLDADAALEGELQRLVAQLPEHLASDIEWAHVRWVMKGDQLARLASSSRHAAARLASWQALEVLGDVLSDQHGGCWRVEVDYVEPGKVVRLADRRAR